MSAGNWLAYLNRKHPGTKRRRIGGNFLMTSRSTSGGQVQSFDELIVNAGGRITLGASSVVNGLLLANDGLSGSLTVPSGYTLALSSGASFTLNGQNISTTGTLGCGNVTCGSVTASGAINANAGAALTGTITGTPTWNSTQTFPGVTTAGTVALAGATVTGQPTWSSAQTIPGLTTTSGTVKLGTAGNAFKVARKIVLKYESSMFTILQGADAGDSLSSLAVATAVTLFGYATQRSSITYTFATALPNAQYFVIASASVEPNVIEFYDVFIAHKTTTTFRVHMARADSNTIGSSVIELSLLVVTY